MAKEYEIPVWFRMTADNVDQAWAKTCNALRDLEQYDQLPPYVVEEPVELLRALELLTGSDGWNPTNTLDAEA